MRASTMASAVLLLAGCVPLPEGEGVDVSRAPAAVDAGFTLLDPGAQRLVSLHFETHAYGAGKAAAASETAEALYRKVMEDTGLYSFMPRSLYPLVVYGTREEFLRKTNLPQWSAGAAVGSAIYLPEGGDFKGTLAHEMTHLIFNEFMGRLDPQLRWINEGLAVYEEDEARGGLRNRASTRPIPFREMVNLAPLGERDAIVGDWYGQVGDVTRFMIERGGRVGFGEFLKALRDGRSLDDAIRSGFPGSWSGAASLEAAWIAGR